MKKIFTKFILAVLIISLLPCQVLAAGTFSDVSEGHWGTAYIDRCYELGLMVGTSDSTFSPSGTLTVAQAITTAVRLRDRSTGEVGSLDQSGEHWYDSAVAAALRLGIIAEGEFDSYTRPATRAELAGLLGKALPQHEYRPINNISSLPDVDEYTPYSAEIFKLYRAGVLTGNDIYGSFSPYNNISRVELAALLCRLADPESRKELNLLPKPADTTVRTTACRLVIAGIPVYGVVEMNGEYYIPGDILDDDNVLPERMVYLNVYTEKYDLDIDPGRLRGSVSVIEQSFWPEPGIELGMAEPWSVKFIYNDEESDALLYRIDGRCPLVPLEAIGAVRQGNDFVLYPNGAQDAEIVWEEDLIGSIPASLKGSCARDTLVAIHDYIVNTLTYDPRVSGSYTTEENNAKVDALWTEAQTRYNYGNNLALATGYGICENYAEIFQSMCWRLGIPCVYVSGVAGGGSHAWNAVYVDGKWQYMDCTWDDPVGWSPTLRWKYCLVDANAMAITHCWLGEDYPMPAEYDPEWESLDPNNITSADMYRKCLIAQMMQGKTSFSLRVTVSGAYGGHACVFRYASQTKWSQLSGGYNSYTGTYDYNIIYWE